MGSAGPATPYVPSGRAGQGIRARRGTPVRRQAGRRGSTGGWVAEAPARKAARPREGSGPPPSQRRSSPSSLPDGLDKLPPLPRETGIIPAARGGREPASRAGGAPAAHPSPPTRMSTRAGSVAGQRNNDGRSGGGAAAIATRHCDGDRDGAAVTGFAPVATSERLVVSRRCSGCAGVSS